MRPRTEHRLPDGGSGHTEHLKVVVLDAPSNLGLRPGPGGAISGVVALLQPLLAHPSVRGIDLCIYDPALDTPDHPGALLLADLLARAFSG